MKQTAYARKIFGAEGKTKKQIALSVGYAPQVANSVSSHIENTEGFNNAMAKLAAESNNLALKVMHEFKSRGVEDFSNKDLVGALNAIANAWSKFNGAVTAAKQTDPAKNRLRTVILQRIENQTIQGDKIKSTPATYEEVKEEAVEAIDEEVSPEMESETTEEDSLMDF
jgi:hypothetical protein